MVDSLDSARLVLLDHNLARLVLRVSKFGSP
jgi:hypothetical protein